MDGATGASTGRCLRPRKKWLPGWRMSMWRNTAPRFVPGSRDRSEAFMTPGNLFDGAEAPAEGERFDVLLEHENLVIERIVSSSSITPAQYLQTQDEWVLLAQ